MKRFFAEERPHDGLQYSDYLEEWEAQTKASPAEVDRSERQELYYLQANWERQAHVHNTYSPPKPLREAVSNIEEPQLWMVLTEPWCGDSAFLLPVLAEAAGLSDMITLRILYRDDNLDIMDQYLTEGSRSIPKLVAFSREGEELFTWGPRPESARRKFEELRNTYDDKMKVIEGLITYYEEGGWQETDDELTDSLRSTVPASSAE